MAHLVPFAPNVWTIEGPVVDFFGFPYPTRSVVIRLCDQTSWIWSPVGPLTDELAKEVVETAGPVQYLVSPNKIHWLFLQPWKDRFPQAKLLASPGLPNRRVARDLSFDGVLTEHAPDGYAADIDQLIVHSWGLDEVVFFHKDSHTAIFCDLIQRHFEKDQVGWKGWLMKVDGMVGPTGSTPYEWRFLLWITGNLPGARRQLNRIIYEWQPERMLIAHGENAETGATEVIAKCLRWIPQHPRECICCRPTATVGEAKED